MKNKKLTYVLGAVVLIVWGLIIYRIIAAVGGDDDEIIQNQRPVVSKDPYNDFALIADTTKLLLNYRDPFGIVQQKDTNVSFNKPRIRQAPTAVRMTFNWGFIEYSGYLYNPALKKTVTLVTINGHAETFVDGITKDNVKLIKNMRDSIKISYNGMVKYIQRRPLQ